MPWKCISREVNRVGLRST